MSKPRHSFFRKKKFSPRGEMASQQKARAGTLRERFPQVSCLKLELRMEAPTGVILDQSTRVIGLDETLLLDLPCQGSCGNGMFMLKDAVESLLQVNQERREGMGICQGVSYMDPKMPCGTKLYYSIDVTY